MMVTLAEKLHKWSLDELNLVSEGSRNQIPDISCLRSLTKGKNKKVWNYVVNHVRSQAVVRDIKRSLHIKKVLNEKKSHAIFYNNVSLDVEKLQSAVSTAAEKNKYLKRNLSIIEERILLLDQNIQRIKNEILQTNQKAALLELLKQLILEKSLIFRNLNSELSLHKSELSAYQLAKVSDRFPCNVPREFFSSFQVGSGENVSKTEDLLDLISLCNKNSNNECKDLTTGNFVQNVVELKKNGLLTQLVDTLIEASSSDLEHFNALCLQDIQQPDVSLCKSKKKSSNVLLNQMKCDNVYNSVAVIKNKEKVEELLLLQKEIFNDKFKGAKTDSNDKEFELTLMLIEKQAENEALIVGNNYLDDYLKSASLKANSILENFQNQKKILGDLSSAPEIFHNLAGLTYFLMYTSSDTFQKVLNVFHSMQSFARNEIFDSALPQTTSLEELKESLVSDRKQSLYYCDKAGLVETYFCKPYASNHLQSTEVLKTLNLKPFQNISFLCKNWTRVKQKLHARTISYSERFTCDESIQVSEMNLRFSEMLEKMKLSIEKGLFFISEGTMYCNRTKFVIQEWWEQNAQYIPDIEYEGKTLKMWIDILSVLTEFEPQAYPSKLH